MGFSFWHSPRCPSIAPSVPSSGVQGESLHTDQLSIQGEIQDFLQCRQWLRDGRMVPMGAQTAGDRWEAVSSSVCDGQCARRRFTFTPWCNSVETDQSISKYSLVRHEGSDSHDKAAYLTSWTVCWFLENANWGQQQGSEAERKVHSVLDVN